MGGSLVFGVSRWSLVVVPGALALALAASSGCGEPAPQVEGRGSTTDDGMPPANTWDPPEQSSSTHDGGTDAGEGSSGGEGSSEGTMGTGGDSDSGDEPTVDALDPRQRVIYLAMTDRFVNGDRTNDLAGTPSCFDPTNDRRFHGGDFRGLIENLDYLEALGVTSIWVTPVQAQIGEHFTSCGYHGYWADWTNPDDHRIEPKLGTEAEFEELIGELHERDMELIVDMVVNHTGYGAQLVGEHPSWFHTGEDCATQGNPEIYCSLANLPDLAQGNPEVVTYLEEQVQHWLTTYGFDGIRMDTIKHVEPQFFAESWVPAVRAAAPETFLVGEALVEGTLDPLDTYLQTGFDSLFNFPLRRGLIQSFAQDSSVDHTAQWVRATYDRFGPEQAQLMTNLLDNHDVPRFTTELEWAQTTDSPDAYRLALTTLFTIPGIPQLYYGNEIGMLGGGDPDNRRDMPQWAFDEVGRQGEREGYLGDPSMTFEHIAKLSEIRRDTPALWAGDYAEVWRQNGVNLNVYAFFRGTEGSRAVVVVNAESDPVELAFDLVANPGIDDTHKALLQGDVFVELLGEGASGSSQDGQLNVVVPARRAAIFVAED